MSKYNVSMHIIGYYETEVEADSQQEAIDIAFDEADFGDLCNIDAEDQEAEIM